MNNSVYDILDYYFDSSVFQLGAENLLTEAQSRIIHNATNRLETLAEKCIVKDEVRPSKDLIDETYFKFHSQYNNPNNLNFSSREIRALLYSMHLFGNAEMRSFLRMLNNQWKNRFFNGLLFYILSKWESSDKNNLNDAVRFLKDKLSKYEGKRDKYSLLQKNIVYLSPNGPELLGIALRREDEGQSNYCSILNAPLLYFGIQSNRIDLEYYSRVIVAYFEKDAVNKIDILKNVLAKHNNNITPKRIIPALILRYKAGINEAIAERIKTLAISMIGNPDIPAKWTMPNASDQERYNLEEARKILNEWVKKKFLAIFFDKCVHEEERKRYWLQHINMIDDVEVCCSEYTMSLLMADSRISDIVPAKTNVMTNEERVNKSALILSIGNLFVVEFSDVGCIYIYRKDSPIGRTMDGKRYIYIEELKRPRFDTIQSFNYRNFKEGKIPHQSGWQDLLNKWFDTHLYLNFR